MVKVGHSKEDIKHVERVMNRGMEVPRFDYNKHLHYFSKEEGAIMLLWIVKPMYLDSNKKW